MVTRRWFTSDLHLGDEWTTKMRYCGTDIAKHDDWLASRWDKNIGPDDEVWILGDMTRGMEMDDLAEWLSKRVGTKILVMGNNDDDVSRDVEVWSAAGFDLVCRGTTIMLKDGTDAALSHYPDEHNDGVMFHGHTHKKAKVSRTFDDGINIHVGWDAWRRFVPEDDIIALINIEKVTDLDERR